VRAALVVVVAVAVGIFVLARTGSTPTPAATHQSTTSAPTTVPRAARVTTTTLSATTSTTLAPSTTLVPSKVTVLVLNGWTVRHAALYFQRKLSADGYDTLAPTNATTETNKNSLVFVVNPRDIANARAVAGLVGAPLSALRAPTPANDSTVPASMLHQADLVLVVGSDISGQVPAHYNG
jgi:hypothetical protein